jgi:hypothetical protein
VTGEAANRPYGPLFFASQVLADGRVIVNGGEADYSQQSGNPAVFQCSTNPAVDSTKGSLYDPQTNAWVPVPPPAGWATIGDAASVLLGVNTVTGAASNSNYMVQNCCDNTGPPNFNPLPTQFQAAIATITPRPGNTVTWTTTAAGKQQPNNEEGWTLLTTGQVLTVNTNPCNPAPGVCNPLTTEWFDPATRQWRNAGNTPATLVSQNPRSETGPAVGIGQNMVVACGWANGTIAGYRFAFGWTAQTAFPGGVSVPDGPASLLPNGNILVQTGVQCTMPSTFFEFNSSALTPVNPGPVGSTATGNQPQCPAGAGANVTNTAAFQGRMILLPTGQVLWNAGEGVNCTSIYTTTTAGNPNPAMRPPPRIFSLSSSNLTQGNTFSLNATMLRGWSQGAAYGDDAQSSTNYPLVLITNNTTQNRCFARTHNWDSPNSVQFDIPPAVTPAANWLLIQHACDTTGGGASTLVVIVNGFVSNSMPVTVQ